MKHDQNLQGEAAGLRRLSELKGYKVAEGDPDVRGWTVKSSDGRTIGKVDDLVVDTREMRARYLAVDLEKEFATSRSDKKVLLPVGSARLDDRHDDVLVNLAGTDLASLPAFGSAGAYDRTTERSLRDRFGTTAGTTTGATTGATTDRDEDFYRHEAYDDSRFFGTRREGREKDNYLVLSEERLEVGKEQVQAGEAHVRKHVETEHVQERVPVTREEVTIERRPVSGELMHAGSAQIGEDEIVVPIMEERLVTEKRVVPVEEVVIRKTARTEEQVVEADLRKERVDIDEATTRAQREPRRDEQY